ncbi:MAG: hypothetical protein WBG46_03075 [Nonlabens sp.]
MKAIQYSLVKISALLIIVTPLFLLLQNQATDASNALSQNGDLIAQLGQLAPMGINPYIAVFATSVFSKLGIHNDFVANHPFYDSWIVLILFGVLFLYTAIIGTIINSSKIAKPFGLADSWLTDKAGIIIQIVITLIPAFMSSEPQLENTIIEAGILSVTLKTVLIVVASIYFLIVVSTVRLFIDILIFLSPIPLVDAVLNIIKIFFTIALVLISIFSPVTSFIITIALFLVGLLMFNKARRLVIRTKYYMIYPIIELFRSGTIENNLQNHQRVKALTLSKIGKIKKGRVVVLKKRGKQTILQKQRFLLPAREEVIDLDKTTLSRKHIKIEVLKEEEAILALNRSYFKHDETISQIFNIPLKGTSTTTETISTGIWAKMKALFSKDDLKMLKT